MNKTCQKCGHTAEIAGHPDEACPQCGGIYAKVDAYIRDHGPIKHVQSSQPHAAAVQRGSAQPMSRDSYVALLRSQSLYPTARWWINLIHTVITVVCVLGAIIGVFVLGKAGEIGVLLGTLVFFALLWLGSRIMKELGLMVIDLCDAGVRTAYQAEQVRV